MTKANFIRYISFIFALAVAFLFSTHNSVSYAQNNSSDIQSALSPDTPAWVQETLDFGRYIEANAFVVTDDAVAIYEAKIAKAQGKEKLTLLYHYVLEATFYVYDDIMGSAKPAYIAEIERQDSDIHRQSLKIMETFTDLYVKGNYDKALLILNETGQNEALSPIVRARALMMSGYAYGLRRELDKTLEVLQDIETLFGGVELDPYFQTELMEFEGFALMVSGDNSKAVSLMRERVDMANNLGLLITGDSYTYHFARMVIERGEISAIYEMDAINQSVASLTGSDRSRFNAAFLCGENFLKLMDNPRALKCLNDAEKYIPFAHDRKLYLYYNLIIAHARAGEAQTARDYFERLQSDPKFEDSHIIKKDLPLAIAELYHVEGKFTEAFKVQRDYFNELKVRHANELGLVSKQLREYSQEQTSIQNERAALLNVNSALKDKVITKQRVVSYVGLLIAVGGILFGAIQVSLSKKLKKARIEADTANRSKSEFLANMSHEIRTPMNGVLGMTEVLLKSGLSEKQKTYANTVYKSGTLLMGILNDILDFSKIEAGKMELDPTPFDLDVALNDVATLLGPTAREKLLECNVCYAPALPKRFVGDEGRIRQILMNLTSNAIKFTQEGSVTLKVSGAVSEGQAHLRLCVIDTGIGITKEQADKIFEGFMQAEGSTTRKFGGTGLGLTISRQLVEAMGGQIGVDSVEGQGSEFWVELTLPVAKAAVRSAPLGDTRSHVKTESKPTLKIEVVTPAKPLTKSDGVLQAVKILIIDPSSTSARVTYNYLTSSDADVSHAKDSQQALVQLRKSNNSEKPFDVAIMDYQMAGINGAVLAKSIHEDSAVGDVKIILLSRTDITQYAGRLSKIGVDEVLIKPVSQTVLIKTVCHILSNRNIENLKSVKTPVGLSSDLNQEMISVPPIKERVADTVITHKPRLLLVDDNETNRVVLSSLINPEAYDIQEAENGKIALKLSKKTKFDLIFMDISMPVMDGVKATQLIRSMSDSLNKTTPIIACTAHALKGDSERFTSVGMNDYVSKPIHHIDIQSTLEKWVLEKQQAA